MFISIESWHGRVYRWWHKSKYHTLDEPTRVNLCPYVRRVLIRAPLRWLLIAGKVGTVHVPWATWTTLIASPTLIGTNEFGFEYAKTIGLIILLILGMVGYLRISETSSWKKLDHTMKEKAVSFRELVAATLRPIHDRICPNVEFKVPK